MKENGAVKPKRRKRGRPTLEASIKQDEILAIALQCFAEWGFEGVSINQISKQANVNDSLLHYYFKTKENLWKKAVSLAYSKYIESAEMNRKLLKDLDLLSLAKAQTRHFIYFNGSNPGLYQVIMHEMSTKSKRSDWIIEEVLNPISEKFGILHSALIDKGFIKNIPLSHQTSILLGSCNTIFILKQQMSKHFGIDVADKQTIEEHADVVIKILFSGLEK